MANEFEKHSGHLSYNFTLLTLLSGYSFIENEYAIEYQGQSGLIALLHRLGLEHCKPKAVSCKLAPQKQVAFIKGYEDLLTTLTLMKRCFSSMWCI